MPTTLDRLVTERQFHNEQAAERAETYLAGRADLRFADDDYLDHETWVRPAFASLGDLRGKAALDYGCGHGMASIVLARRGAIVTGFDLSPGYVGEAERRAVANGVNARFIPADAEQLPFPSDSFDVVWGNAVLHHLDLARAGIELRRVMRHGGVGVFCEPWGGNPLLTFARRWLPYPGKDRTPDEQPLRPYDLKPLRECFPGLRVEGYQLLSMVRRVCPNSRLMTYLTAVDSVLLAKVPLLGMWCRYVVLIVRKV